MKSIRGLYLATFTFILLCCIVGCQETIVASEISRAPSLTPEDQILRTTRAPRDVAERETIPSPSADASLFETTGHPPTITLPAPLLTQIAPPLATATLPPGAVIIGASVEGRSILARRLGDGAKTLMLVGGLHGGWEANTVTLVNELIAHFEANPGDILPGMSLALIPVANPDGLLRGREEVGRFNANSVDLNRNWGCEWSPDATWRQQSVDAGDQPFSEPETRALADFITAQQPAVVLFYHSAAGGIFAGSCEGDHGSMVMSEVLGQATGYTYGQPFSAYPVTGTGASWVDGLGIPSADVELQSWTESEFERNLRGVMALQCWLAGQAERCT